MLECTQLEPGFTDWDTARYEEGDFTRFRRRACELLCDVAGEFGLAVLPALERALGAPEWQVIEAGLHAAMAMSEELLPRTPRRHEVMTGAVFEVPGDMAEFADKLFSYR